MTQKTRPQAKAPSPESPSRVVIEQVEPEIDAGRYPAARALGEPVTVTAHVYVDGHDSVGAALLYRHADDRDWTEVPMELANWGVDLWQASFPASRLGSYHFTVQGWVDRFKTWRRDLRKKVEAGQDVAVDLLAGAELVEAAARRAAGEAARSLQAEAKALNPKGGEEEVAAAVERALRDDLAALVAQHAERRFAVTYEKELLLRVDPPKARSSAWYEMFPRSAAAEPGRHGTFKDCEKRLPYVAALGFDVLYLPPIHPVGRTNRKGKNNQPDGAPDDVGSPWAIGAAEGGHKAIHPQLGTLADFKRLLAKAKEYGIEIALDLAFQCTPDHPYVKEHPEWFRLRPDGSIQYAENPPKKYEDIYPLDFETDDWQALWEELKSVVLFWCEQGVRLFRVDNPHTKPFRFWEWLLAEIRREHPDAIFLAEAFTRPNVMYQLAKLGFTQSYTYFAWRNTKWDLTEYFTELTRSPLRHYFRPHLWPNTPDILTEYLQFGGRPAFMARLVLAATLGANYGIYGPAFELAENRPRSPGSEEYMNSEKYELRYWDLDRPDSLREFIARVNRIRRDNPALQSDARLRFHAVDNDQLIAYSKLSDDGANIILAVVNLDPHHTQSGWLDWPVQEVGIDPGQTYQVHDLLTDARYFWRGTRNYVELNPHSVPAHIFRVRRRLRSERDFDYFI